jgi:segregation and condensation protein A
LTRDERAGQATWTVRTEIFDGPLDLLLYLVKRDGIDLRQLSVRRIADSYLEFIDRMRDLNLSLAADWLVMAAMLCHMKSLEILPRPPTLIAEGDEEDPREELARRLEEYARYKEASEWLEQRSILGRDVFVRTPMPIDGLDQPLIPGVDAFGLLETYYELLTRAAQPPPTHVIGRAGTTLTEICQRLLTRLGGPGGRASFGEILLDFLTRADRILAFLAILEMARLQWIQLIQEVEFGEIWIVAKIEGNVDLSAIEAAIEVAGTHVE